MLSSLDLKHWIEIWFERHRIKLIFSNQGVASSFFKN